jgi:DNA cross-link repair 1A protein
LVHQQLRVHKNFLHPLELLTPTVIESRGKPITVTLLDANHCPGAVMFLFQIGTARTTNILHVGDFRWNRDTMLQKSSPLLPFTAQGTSPSLRLDELYLDTTYCEEKYSNIPSQREAIDATMKVIEKELADCAKRRLKPLILFGSYAIGKERLYLEICERLKVKAMVDKRRYNTLAALNLPPEKMKLLTTTEDTFIRIVPLGHINFKQMPTYFSAAGAGGSYALSKPFDCIIGFRPTGWTISEKRSTKEVISKRTSGNLTIYGVPYSEHSNFVELVGVYTLVWYHNALCASLNFSSSLVPFSKSRCSVYSSCFAYAFTFTYRRLLAVFEAEKNHSDCFDS